MELELVQQEISDVPLQERIADRFRRMIREGTLRAGERLPTVRQTATELSVSNTPARIAFQILEKEGLIHTRRGAGTFVGRESMYLPKTLDIGVFYRQPRHWTNYDNYGLQMLFGIQNALQEGGHNTSLATIGPGGRNISSVAEQLLHRPVHGYILDERISDELAERFVKTGRPVVMINRPCAVAGVGSVLRDDALAGRLAAGQIVAHGHTVIACLFVPQNDYGARAAFSHAIVSHPDASRTLISLALDNRQPPEEYYAVFERLMEHRPLPTAVFVADDLNAVNFARWAQERGLRVPEDISVVGNFDLALAATTTPPLSTIHFDPAEIGTRAVDEVVACCRESGRVPQSHLIGGQWVERQSLLRT